MQTTKVVTGLKRVKIDFLDSKKLSIGAPKAYYVPPPTRRVGDILFLVWIPSVSTFHFSAFSSEPFDGFLANLHIYIVGRRGLDFW